MRGAPCGVEKLDTSRNEKPREEKDRDAPKRRWNGEGPGITEPKRGTSPDYGGFTAPPRLD